MGARRVGQRLSPRRRPRDQARRGRRSPSSGSSRGDEWYACQNICPHKREMVLSRGILGDQQGVPKVACPLHKKTFSLESGQCLSGESYRVEVFPVRVEGDDVFVELPSEARWSASPEFPNACAVACVVNEPTPSLRISEPRIDESSRLPPRRPCADLAQCFLLFRCQFHGLASPRRIGELDRAGRSACRTRRKA